MTSGGCILDVARPWIVRAAKRAGIALDMAHEREAQTLHPRASGYDQARQFKRLKNGLTQQRGILGIVLREVTASPGRL